MRLKRHIDPSPAENKKRHNGRSVATWAFQTPNPKPNPNPNPNPQGRRLRLTPQAKLDLYVDEWVGHTLDGESSLSEGHVEAMKNDLHNCGVEYAHPLHMRLKKAHRSIPR